MKSLKMIPQGWPTRPEDCYPGFLVIDGELYFRAATKKKQIYNSAGGRVDEAELGDRQAQNVIPRWEE